MQVSVAEHSGDFVHQCNSGILALDEEDIKIIGTWSDFTGSDFGLRTSPENIRNQNLPNKIMGMEGWVRENVQVKPRSVRGTNTLITRTRPHHHYIPDTYKVQGNPK